MMCYYLNVQFHGQRVNKVRYSGETAKPIHRRDSKSNVITTFFIKRLSISTFLYSAQVENILQTPGCLLLLSLLFLRVDTCQLVDGVT